VAADRGRKARAQVYSDYRGHQHDKDQLEHNRSHRNLEFDAGEQQKQERHDERRKGCVHRVQHGGERDAAFRQQDQQRCRDIRRQRADQRLTRCEMTRAEEHAADEPSRERHRTIDQPECPELPVRLAKHQLHRMGVEGEADDQHERSQKRPNAA
jgi:hypothetical protein